MQRAKTHFRTLAGLLGQTDELRTELRKQLETIKSMLRQQETVLCSLPSLAVALSANCLTTSDFLPDNLRPLWDLVAGDLGVYERELGLFFTKEMSGLPNQAQFRSSMLGETDAGDAGRQGPAPEGQPLRGALPSAVRARLGAGLGLLCSCWRSGRSAMCE